MTTKNNKVQERFLEVVIESLRDEMIQIGLTKGLTSPETITISQRLDYFISEYQKLVHMG